VENQKSEIQDPSAVYEVTGLQASLLNVKVHRLRTQHNKDPLTVDVWRVVSSKGQHCHKYAFLSFA
jgi:hypothetical protein